MAFIRNEPLEGAKTFSLSRKDFESLSIISTSDLLTNQESKGAQSLIKLASQYKDQAGYVYYTGPFEMIRYINHDSTAAYSANKHTVIGSGKILGPRIYVNRYVIEQNGFDPQHFIKNIEPYFVWHEAIEAVAYFGLGRSIDESHALAIEYGIREIALARKLSYVMEFTRADISRRIQNGDNHYDFKGVWQEMKKTAEKYLSSPVEDLQFP